jgi:hypothetical protein
MRRVHGCSAVDRGQEITPAALFDHDLADPESASPVVEKSEYDMIRL